jgi:hypothetical protein
MNYQHILQTIREREEQRFLITFGLYHKYWFEEHLAQETWLRFTPVTEQLRSSLA